MEARCQGRLQDLETRPSHLKPKIAIGATQLSGRMSTHLAHHPIEDAPVLFKLLLRGFRRAAEGMPERRADGFVVGRGPVLMWTGIRSDFLSTVPCTYTAHESTWQNPHNFPSDSFEITGVACPHASFVSDGTQSVILLGFSNFHRHVSSTEGSLASDTEGFSRLTPQFLAIACRTTN